MEKSCIDVKTYTGHEFSRKIKSFTGCGKLESLKVTGSRDMFMAALIVAQERSIVMDVN